MIGFCSALLTIAALRGTSKGRTLQPDAKENTTNLVRAGPSSYTKLFSNRFPLVFLCPQPRYQLVSKLLYHRVVRGREVLLFE